MKGTINVQNLKCGGCANTIKTRLAKLSGITHVAVDEKSAQVKFNYDTLNDLASAERTLVNLGYPPEGIDNKLITKTRSFVSCATGKLN